MYGFLAKSSISRLNILRLLIRLAIFRGATEQILDEAERSIHDALYVLTSTVKETKTVYGRAAEVRKKDFLPIILAKLRNLKFLFFPTCSFMLQCIRSEKPSRTSWNGILFQQLFWPTCSFIPLLDSPILVDLYSNKMEQFLILHHLETCRKN